MNQLAATWAQGPWAWAHGPMGPAPGPPRPPGGGATTTRPARSRPTMRWTSVCVNELCCSSPRVDDGSEGGAYTSYACMSTEANRSAPIIIDHQGSPAQATRATPIAAFTTAPRRNVSRPVSHKVSSASRKQAQPPRRDEHSERSDAKKCSARAAATTPSANLV